MKIESFEDIQSWQKAKSLTIFIYGLFKNHKDFKFRDQIQSATISIMNNIAEGFERKGNNELKRFLYISKGSCAEVRSMLYLALEMKFISKEDFKTTHALSLEISRMLSGFIKTL